MDTDTSKTILFLTIAGSVAVLTVLGAWLLIYAITVVRQAQRIVQGVAEALTNVHAMLDGIKDALSNSTSHLSFLAAAVKEATSFFLKRRQQRSTDENEDEDDEPQPRRGRKR